MGKEGVDGSSPSEGSAKSPLTGNFSFRTTCRLSFVRWVWSRLWSFRVENASRRHGSVACDGTQSYRRASVSSLRHDDAQHLLAPLRVGDQLSWKLDEQDDPQWLTVVEVVSDLSYLVQYPDGTTELLVDSE
jgi:hypothetical protein